LSAKTDWKSIFLESESETPAREPFPLPMYPELTREAQRYVVDAIAEFFG